MESAYNALKKCSEDFVSESALKTLLGLEPGRSLSTHPAWSLFDQTEQDGQIYFSVNGLGLIVLKHFAALDKIAVYLSRQAVERFDGLDQTQQKKFASCFDKLCEPGWIEQKRHDEYQNPGGAITIKPGNVDERLFIYQLDDGSILVAELAFHQPNGSYDRVPKHRKDYDTYRLWEAK